MAWPGRIRFPINSLECTTVCRLIILLTSSQFALNILLIRQRSTQLADDVSQVAAAYSSRH